MQPTVSRTDDRVGVWFPEADPTTRPAGMDLSYRPDTDTCVRALMD